MPAQTEPPEPRRPRDEDHARRVALTFSRALPDARVHLWRGHEQRDLFVAGRYVGSGLRRRPAER